MRRLIQRTGVAALAVLALSAAVVPAASSAATKKTTVQKVSVTAKEFSFKLSKTKVNVGTVKFTIKNAGKIPHDFKINGKTSKMIASGKSTTLTVVFKKKGSFKYVCTVPGHAKLGMEGSLGVGVAAKKTAPPTKTTPVSTQPVGTTPSTIYVQMKDFAFTFYSDAAETTPWPMDSAGHYTVPSGPVTFVVSSIDEQHNFAFEALNYPGTSNAVASNFLAAGNPPQTMTPIPLAPGTYTYECEVGQHAEEGMLGYLDVTADA